MTANEVIVLNSLDDKVYRVDFESGDEKLINGQLEEKWETFDATDFAKKLHSNDIFIDVRV